MLLWPFAIRTFRRIAMERADSEIGREQQRFQFHQLPQIRSHLATTRARGHEELHLRDLRNKIKEKRKSLAYSPLMTFFIEITIEWQKRSFKYGFYIICNYESRFSTSIILNTISNSSRKPIHWYHIILFYMQKTQFPKHKNRPKRPQLLFNPPAALLPSFLECSTVDSQVVDCACRYRMRWLSSLKWGLQRLSN